MAILYGAVIGGKLYRIDTETGTETVVGDGVNRDWVGVCSYEGKIYAAANSGTLYEFDGDTGSLLRSVFLINQLFSCATDGTNIYVGTTWGLVYVVSISTFVGTTSDSWAPPNYQPIGIDFGAGRFCSVTRRVSDFASKITDGATLSGQTVLATISDTTIWGCCRVSGGIWAAGNSVLYFISNAGSVSTFPYPSAGQFWGVKEVSGSLFLSVTGGKIYSRDTSLSASALTAVTSTDRDWQDIGRFTRTSVSSLFGAPFQGFERGWSLTINRRIETVDVLGGAPVLIPIGPASLDTWDVSAELWVNGKQAAALEAAAPPYGSGPSEIYVPTRGGAATFAGLAPASAGSTVDLYQDAVLTSLESLGKKGVGVDLYGYRVGFSLSVSSGTATTPTTTTMPPWLPQKFRAHQLNDWSKQARTVAPGGGWSASAHPIRAGRRRDLGINLDHLDNDQADALVAWFRGVREASVSLPFVAGPGADSATSYHLLSLSFTRGPGLLWTASLEVSAA